MPANKIQEKAPRKSRGLTYLLDFRGRPPCALPGGFLIFYPKIPLGDRPAHAELMDFHVFFMADIIYDKRKISVEKWRLQ